MHKRLENQMNLADADAAMKRIAELTNYLDVADDDAQARANEILDTHKKATEADRQELERCERELRLFILDNPALFHSPRSRKTAWGTYGMRASTELLLDADLAPLKAHSDAESLGLVAEVLTLKPDRASIRKLLAAGVTLPGASLKAKQGPFRKVAKLIPEEA